MPAPTSPAALTLTLKALRLPTLAASWADLAAQATEEGWDHPRFLAALCELELAGRSDRRLAAALAGAKLPPGKRLDSFSFAAVPGLARARVQDLMTGAWLRERHNALLIGSSGTGKSHVAAAIAYGVIEAGHTALFTRTGDLVQRLLTARRDLTLPTLLAKLDRVDCLVLDDLGYVRKDAQESSVLFELIAHRYEHRSLLITCDRPFAQWDSIFPDQIMAVAAIDRLVHHATILEFGNDSYRRKTAATRAATPKPLTEPEPDDQDAKAKSPR
jgi:DNA replication protein DnaC